LDTANPIASAKPGLNAKSSVNTTWLQKLGPGLITGAADDDPSGIATYSQVGAMFGYSMMWVMLFSLPLMIAIQEICARIGRVTGVGIAGNMRKHYPAPLMFAIVSLLCLANIFNLGADIGAMGAAAQLLVGGPLIPYVIGFAVVSLFLQVYIRYTQYVKYLKWLTLALFAYVLTPFVARVAWGHALRSTLVPSVTFNVAYFTALVAVLGTTVSPYLFFWQASEEAEDVRDNSKEHPLKWAPWQARKQFERIRVDTVVGMGFSNVVSLFIILTTAATLHAAGITIFRLRRRRPRDLSRWRVDLRSNCLRLASSERVCWRCQCWLDRRRMESLRRSNGRLAWNSGPRRPSSFMECWRSLR
jgi:NRAMP (natural resistance-associated macrophage protein)-like metal ion transporter